MTLQRIVVIGTTGAGKSTLASSLATLLDAPYVELDALYWGPQWTPVGRERFRARVATFAADERWVAAGNYGAVRDLLWSRADTVVWLDYPLALNFWRLTRRSLRRIVTREALWAGNRETFRSQFLSRDSLYVWAVRSHARHRREFAALLADPTYAHLDVVRFASPRDTARWLAGLSPRSR
jgi:adenylate kinase family enzyme